VVLPVLDDRAPDAIAALVCRQAWPCGEALAVMACESSGDPNAYNAGNYGLMQINQVHAARVGGNLEALYDPETNLAVAYAIWLDHGGWGPWACKPW